MLPKHFLISLHPCEYKDSFFFFQYPHTSLFVFAYPQQPRLLLFSVSGKETGKVDIVAIDFPICQQHDS